MRNPAHPSTRSSERWPHPRRHRRSPAAGSAAAVRPTFAPQQRPVLSIRTATVAPAVSRVLQLRRRLLLPFHRRPPTAAPPVGVEAGCDHTRFVRKLHRRVPSCRRPARVRCTRRPSGHQRPTAQAGAPVRSVPGRPVPGQPIFQRPRPAAPAGSTSATASRRAPSHASHASGACGQPSAGSRSGTAASRSHASR